MNLREDSIAAVADVEVIEKPLLELRGVEGSGNGTTPDLGVV
jgi:hypothetical protein